CAARGAVHSFAAGGFGVKVNRAAVVATTVLKREARFMHPASENASIVPVRHSKRRSRESTHRRLGRCAAVVSLGLVASAMHTASAATKFWDGGATGTGTAWDISTDWSADGVPTSSDTIVNDNSILA